MGAPVNAAEGVERRVARLDQRRRPDGEPEHAGQARSLGLLISDRDGRRIDGTWRRTKTAGPMTFTDADGRPIALHPGQTWVTLQG